MRARRVVFTSIRADHVSGRSVARVLPVLFSSLGAHLSLSQLGLTAHRGLSGSVWMLQGMTTGVDGSGVAGAGVAGVGAGVGVAGAGVAGVRVAGAGVAGARVVDLAGEGGRSKTIGSWSGSGALGVGLGGEASAVLAAAGGLGELAKEGLGSKSKGRGPRPSS